MAVGNVSGPKCCCKIIVNGRTKYQDQCLGRNDKKKISHDEKRRKCYVYTHGKPDGSMTSHITSV